MTSKIYSLIEDPETGAQSPVEVDYELRDGEVEIVKVYNLEYECDVTLGTQPEYPRFAQEVVDFLYQ